MAIAERDFEAAIEALLPRQMKPEHFADPAITATLSQMAQSVGREAFARQQQAIIGRVDSRPLLGKIACPTLVLAGRDDVIMPLEVLEELARGIPGAKLVIIEDCAHVAMLEQPEAVTDALYFWLAGEPRKGPDVLAGTRRAPPA
jgi:pimeloyl-ACP methyl ester carboxylesterase